MIKSYIASTREIDDAKAAVSEILSQLEPEKNMLKNSLGIISCFSEFEDTGVLKAVCDALPFDCIGATTSLCAAGKEIDQVLFNVTVLTSDDCNFKTAAVPLAEKCEESVKSVLTDVLGKSDEKPALFLSCFPLMSSVSGDMIISAIDKVTGGIPIFGTTAVDHRDDYSTSKTIRNGEAFREAAVLAAIYGDVKFSFDVASLDENKIRSQKAIITASEGNILIGVNGKTVLEYLEEIGLTKSEVAKGLGIIPLVVDNNDGTKPLARSVFALTPEGYAVCGGAMPVGAALSVGSINSDDVIKTTERAFKPFVREDGVSLIYSCVARHLVLGASGTLEAEKIRGMAGDGRYMFAYSGGEICPLADANGKLKNYFHNYTVIFCRLS
ncbi:MAG: FIST C-terminal domain-containing protein [Endomicrobium sp.]|jgi:hypothetical protein|nr:FIST C-terminal domain-containing protein [Endomicrobium sp.]